VCELVSYFLFVFCGNNTLKKRALANSRVFKFVKYTKTLQLRNGHASFSYSFFCMISEPAHISEAAKYPAEHLEAAFSAFTVLSCFA